MSCQNVREDAATALLTRSAFPAPVEEHLHHCSDCRDEITALQPLPELLAAGAEAELDPLDPPDELLLERMLAAAAAVRTRRRRTTILIVAAATVLIALPAGVLIHQVTTAGAPESPSAGPGTVVSPVAIQRTATDPTSGVFGKVWLSPASWGSDLTFAIRGVPTGERCDLVVVSHGGDRETAVSWRADYAGTARVSGAVTAAVSDIERIDVVAGSGTVLLRLPVAITN